jgi:hypothetical protein
MSDYALIERIEGDMTGLANSTSESVIRKFLLGDNRQCDRRNY